MFIFFYILKSNRLITALHDVRATCKRIPGLTKNQLKLCYKASDLTTVATEGLELSIKECQFQVSIVFSN